MKNQHHHPNTQFGAKTLYRTIGAYLLAALWAYTFFFQGSDFPSFAWSIKNQPLPHEMAILLIFALPVLALGTFALLLFRATRLKGILLSIMLLSAFCVYILLIQMNFFSYIPCSCAGILHGSWNQQLLFNLFFLVLAAVLYAALRPKTYPFTKFHKKRKELAQNR